MGYWNPSSWKKITHLSFIVNTIVADILVKYSGFSTQWVNSSPPSATYMCQSIRRKLVQIMACCLFSTKPLCKPALGNCQLAPLVTNFSEIIIKISHFSFIIKHLIILSVKWQICRPGGDESKQMIQVPLVRNLFVGGLSWKYHPWLEHRICLSCFGTNGSYLHSAMTSNLPGL